MIKIFKVKIPATTTNLGPGFDCLGLSVEMYNYITVEKSDKLEIFVPDCDKDIIPTDSTNLIVQAMQRVYDYAKVDFIPVKITQENNIPFTRGLGSSAACIVGGILSANELLDNKLSFQEMIDIAVFMDGHPDNVLPAFTGGLTAANIHDDKTEYTVMMPHDKFKFAFIIPDFHLETKEARKVLPSKYTSNDTFVSVSKAVVLTTSLIMGNEKNLKSACDDVLHEPYRKDFIPNFDRIKKAAYSFGADAFFLSGAGPSLACILSRDEDEFIMQMSKYLKTLGNYDLFISPASSKGAEIIK